MFSTQGRKIPPPHNQYLKVSELKWIEEQISKSGGQSKLDIFWNKHSGLCGEVQQSGRDHTDVWIKWLSGHLQP